MTRASFRTKHDRRSVLTVTRCSACPTIERVRDAGLMRRLDWPVGATDGPKQYQTLVNVESRGTDSPRENYEASFRRPTRGRYPPVDSAEQHAWHGPAIRSIVGFVREQKRTRIAERTPQRE